MGAFMLARLFAGVLALGLFACTSPPSNATTGDPKADPKADVPGGSHGDETAPAPHATDLFTHVLGDPKNPAILYVHGGPGGNGTMFEETIAPTLVEKGFYAVSYDQRGSGRSPKGNAEDFTMAKFVADLDDVIFTLKLEKPVLIGHSWGGTLAMKYQEAHPDRVSGTILVGNPIDFPDSLSNIHDRCLAYYEKRILVDDKKQAIKDLHAHMFPNGLTGPFHFAAEDIGQTMEAASDCKLYFPAVADLPAAGSTWATLMLTSPNKDLLMSVEPSVAGALAAHENLFENTTWADVENLQKSGRLYGIYGSEDGLFSEAHNQRLARILGDDHFTLVDGASHVVFVDDADAFLASFTKYVAAMRAQ
jgi:proline iminopeptidase